MSDAANFDAIAVGDVSRFERAITQEDILHFVQLTGDDNPLHVSPAFAAKTPLKDVVVHGMLGASFISTVIGTRLPGPGALWLSQNLEFLSPVRLGDVLTVTSTVTAKHDREHLIDLDTVITNQRNQVVTKGSGRVKVLQLHSIEERDSAGDRPNRVAIVTGGAGGIGTGVCRRLAHDGFKVLVNYKTSKDRADRLVSTIRSNGGVAEACQADIAEPDEAARLVDRCQRLFGPAGVLVNNASPRIMSVPVEQLTWGDVQEHIDVQVRGTLITTQLCLPAMVENRAGRIVNISSQATRGTPVPRWTAYAVAKAALDALTRQMAVELGPRGVTVNAVSPGMTETPLIGDISHKQQLIVARQTPLRRIAQPDDVAGAVAFLVSDDARFITGHNLSVSGGLGMT